MEATLISQSKKRFHVNVTEYVDIQSRNACIFVKVLDIYIYISFCSSSYTVTSKRKKKNSYYKC